ncbi:hypothetical protein MBLNU457_4550t1 [Dothideomycetes sp. NU457]
MPVGQSNKRTADGDPADTPASKNWRINFQDMITVKVGQDEVVFHAPKDILCKSSTFFSKALSKDWIENKERCISLPEDDSDVFTTYL